MQSDQTDIAHAVQDHGQISRSSNMKTDLELLDSGPNNISNEADPDIDKSRKDSNPITNSIPKSIHLLKSHTEDGCHQNTIYNDTNRVSQLGEIPNKETSPDVSGINGTINHDTFSINCEGALTKNLTPCVRRTLLALPITRREHVSRAAQPEQHVTSVNSSSKIITEGSIVDGEGLPPEPKKPKL